MLSSFSLSFPFPTQWLQGKDKEKGWEITGLCVPTQDICPGEGWSGFPWLRYERIVVGWARKLLSFLGLSLSLSLSLSIFLHGFQPNNSQAWLHHRHDMSPFLFVSFVTHRSACKVECNILLSLSSQVSILLFRRKRGHCTLDSDNL